MTKYWGIRPGKEAEIVQQIRQKSILAIGWHEVGDLSSLPDKQAIQEQYNKVFLKHSKSEAAYAVTQLDYFAHEIKVKDITLVPVPQERKVLVGEISGNYEYNPNFISTHYPNLRALKWLKEIPYDEISIGLKGALETPRTVSELTKKHGAEIRRLIEGFPSQLVNSVRQGLSAIHFEDFKAFSHYHKIELNPVTVIAGTNSSGKSALIETILLALQSLTTPYQAKIEEEDALVHNVREGLVYIPNYRELVFGKPDENTDPFNRGFHLGYSMQLQMNSYAIADYFPGVRRDAGAILVTVEMDYAFVYLMDKKVTAVDRVTLSAHTIFENNILQGPKLQIEPESGLWKLSLEKGVEKKSISEDTLTMYRFIPRWQLNGHALSKLRERREIYEIFASVFDPALVLFRQEITERVQYLEPLRIGPQRPYLSQSVKGMNMGAGGYAAIQQFYENQDRQVQFVALPEVLDGLTISKLKVESCALTDAVNKAFRLLGMSQNLHIRKLGETYEAELSIFSNPNTFVSIMDVGFGVSQVLPIIVLGLLSPLDSILIFEQPEIHLHPNAQSGLADFILCLAQTGRRIILETHSEQMIQRFRRRIAENDGDSGIDQVGILFVVPPDGANQGAEIQKASIADDGEIENWPKGFLTSYAEEIRAIRMASIKKSRQKSTAKG